MVVWEVAQDTLRVMILKASVELEQYGKIKEKGYE